MKKFYILLIAIFIVNIASAQSQIFSIDTTYFIPDGPNCPPGSYISEINVSSFPPGDTIKNANDILSVCIRMEHSYAGDLGFVLRCPNGKTMILDPNLHAGSNKLGIPNSTDGSPNCYPSANLPGTGWNYCWSELYPNNNRTFQKLSVSTDTGTIFIIGLRIIDSTDIYNHLNYIKPYDSSSQLKGCLLNGNWRLTITDDWAQDNGYIFRWSIEFPQAVIIPPTPHIILISDTLYSDALTGNQWYNLATGLISGATNNKYHPTQNGNYFTIVSITGQNSDTSNIIFYDNTGLQENYMTSYGFYIYPNPAREILIIEFQKDKTFQNTTISIYNIQGQLCRQIVSNQSKTEIDIQDLSTGLYFVKLNNEKESFVSRFVKE